MTDVIEETTTTHNDGEGKVAATKTTTKTVATSAQTVQYLAYFLFGILEILLLFRLVFKVAGASVSSAFVGMIYSLSDAFIAPFEGIFQKGYSQGAETTSVLEPATIVAIIVYAFVVWGIVTLIRIISGGQQAS